MAPHVEAEYPVVASQRRHPSPPSVQVSRRRMVQQYNTFILPGLGKIVEMVMEPSSV
jgi:hypothetical protein